MFLSTATHTQPLDPSSRLDPSQTSSPSLRPRPVRSRSRPTQSPSPSNPTPYSPPTIISESTSSKRQARQSSRRRSSITLVAVDETPGAHNKPYITSHPDGTASHGRTPSVAKQMSIGATSASATKSSLQRAPKSESSIVAPLSSSPQRKSSRYSPPPALVRNSPAVPVVPTTPVLRSPSDQESAHDYFGGVTVGQVPSPRRKRNEQRLEANLAASPARTSVPSTNHIVRTADLSKYRPVQSSQGKGHIAERGAAAMEDQSKQRDHRDWDRKTMLSRALQKAHTAVLLDNAQNFEGAMDAYAEACELLQQVLVRSTADEERRKLDQIRETYSNRVQELQQLHNPEPPTQPGKSLPARPLSNDSIAETRFNSNMMQYGAVQPAISKSSPVMGNASNDSLPLRMVPAMPQPSTSTSVDKMTLAPPMEPVPMPPPLSPRRNPPKEPDQGDLSESSLQPPLADQPRRRSSEGGSNSWLDTIDESADTSERSSVHSLLEGNLSRKYLQTGDDTEAEFDAALDAAVEAAYDDGLEPFGFDDGPQLVGGVVPRSGQPVTDVYSRDVGVRVQDGGGYYAGDEEAEEEERMLDEMTKDYMLEGFDFGLQTKSALPRQSDSSTFSGTTWHSSVSSSRATGSASLSAVADSQDQLFLAGTKPVGGLPRLSEEHSRPQSSSSASRPGSRTGFGNIGGSVRSRRLSGQNAKQLKIETHPPAKTIQNPAANSGTSTIREEPTSGLRSAEPSSTSLHTLPDSMPKQLINGTAAQPQKLYGTIPRPVLSPADTSFSASPATPGLPMADMPPASPGGFNFKGSRPGVLKKNQSSTSLKYRTMSVSSPDGSDGSAATPLSTTFSAYSNGRNMLPGPPHPPINVPPFSVDGTTSTGLHLFESDIHSPHSPGSPNTLVMDAPIPLEPCPDGTLLRPFWLMRCFYQTIAHPRGGYVSTKLFVPKDVWRVKGVKLKAVDDKVANCDLLTTALLKLGQVDNLDADAVLDEMQALEQVLDQVQATLTKKLGHEVGVHNLSSMFKDAPNPSEAGTGSDAAPSGAHRSVSQGKSYLSTWRKLRSKNSSTGLSSMPKEYGSSGNSGSHGGTQGSGKDHSSLTMSSVPMTTLPVVRFAKRDVNALELSGPNAAYMGSLARLCDAVQVIDQIARQVEDPGLKNSSPTHVGLDLCSRHASEFFGFFICRFVLADLTMLLDKFIKRGSEWVLV